MQERSALECSAVEHVPIVNDAVLCLKILLKGQVTPKRKKEKAEGHQAPFGGDAASCLDYGDGPP